MKKAGRPRAGDRKRDKQLVVMLSTEELEALRAWAGKTGASLSATGRVLLLAAMADAHRK